ncbi:type VI secretion system protein ImpH [Pseudomonas delhiensis]|uniref:Type VI secretion system protein ImpH n=1 Tax=Pseudomonas delhiensis TaxID=366289 RepID=A0A239I9K2_9PSED|nr:type VI secretion system baseplate subunit TssG [Pseudomonas delhiensis]SDK16444.1 type VI secretion system protein ImpH [Pseudomonas delhiensis]SNS90181.1 type VI secretion system protein ImpH [Pseudomonas delhiensis]
MSAAAPTARLAEDFWQRLMAEPHRHDLFQLLRRLDAQGGSPWRLGRAPYPRDEPLRLGQEASMSFASSTLAAVKPRPGSPLHELSIFSFGLFGPNGPLPLHLTEYVRERVQHHGDRSLQDFCDLFHHRLILLFYRAWADAQPTVSLDRAEQRNFDRYLACLIGLGPDATPRDSLPSHAKYALAGHLARQCRDAEGLEKVLRHYFGLPLRLVENCPTWLPIEAAERAQLSAGRQVARLGEAMLLGLARLDLQHGFCIELGPLEMADYQAFLPGAARTGELRDWVRQYLGLEFFWQLRLLLRCDQVQGASLGDGARLGLSSWCGQRHSEADAGDLAYTVEPLDRGCTVFPTP